MENRKKTLLITGAGSHAVLIGDGTGTIDAFEHDQQAAVGVGHGIAGETKPTIVARRYARSALPGCLPQAGAGERLRRTPAFYEGFPLVKFSTALFALRYLICLSVPGVRLCIPK